MNRRGQTNITIGVFIGIFITAVIGLSLFLGTAQLVGPSVSTSTAVNATYTLPAAGATIDLTGQNYISGVVITNATNASQIVPATNYTIGEGVSTSTGVLSVQLTGLTSDYNSESVNVSYVFGPDGYITNSGGRSLASLILIFFGLAIAVVVLVPSIRESIAFR